MPTRAVFAGLIKARIACCCLSKPVYPALYDQLLCGVPERAQSVLLGSNIPQPLSPAAETAGAAGLPPPVGPSAAPPCAFAHPSPEGIAHATGGLVATPGPLSGERWAPPP